MDMTMTNTEIQIQEQNSVLGHSKFTERFFHQILQSLNPNSIQIIYQKKWFFNLNQQWIQILKQLQLSRCNTFQPRPFCLEKPQISTIVYFMHLSFISLKKLNLQCNFINSIEGLSFLGIDTLTDLRLGFNYITCYKSFDKMYWPQLQEIRIDENKTKIINLSRVALKQLQVLFLIDTQKEYTSLHLQDEILLLKIDSDQIMSLKTYTDNDKMNNKTISRWPTLQKSTGNLLRRKMLIKFTLNCITSEANLISAVAILLVYCFLLIHHFDSFLLTHHYCYTNFTSQTM